MWKFPTKPWFLRGCWIFRGRDELKTIPKITFKGSRHLEIGAVDAVKPIQIKSFIETMYWLPAYPPGIKHGNRKFPTRNGHVSGKIIELNGGVSISYLKLRPTNIIIGYKPNNNSNNSNNNSNNNNNTNNIYPILVASESPYLGYPTHIGTQPPMAWVETANPAVSALHSPRWDRSAPPQPAAAAAATTTAWRRTRRRTRWRRADTLQRERGGLDLWDPIVS